jgi:hypothetical protein
MLPAPCSTTARFVVFFFFFFFWIATFFFFFFFFFFLPFSSFFFLFLPFSLLQTSITDNGKCPIPAGQRTAYDKDRAFFLMWLSGAAYKGRFLTAKNLPPDFAVLKHYNIPIHLFQNLVSFIGVSHKHRRIVVTNRGTPGLSVQLLQQAVDTGPDTFPGSKTVVLVNYFRDASFRMVSKIQADLAEIVKSFPDYGVTFTGHSLGNRMVCVSGACLKCFFEQVAQLQRFGFGSLFLNTKR